MKDKIYYGEQTKAALQNFPFPKHLVHLELIYGIAEVKKAAALAHKIAGEMPAEIADAIATVADEIIAGKHDEQFVTCALQGGAGTSINMNVNEVIANRANELCKLTVHPNDHVNESQSTNDVNPSAMKIACIRLTKELLKNLDVLIKSFEDKARQYRHIMKIGRTHIQDAVPTTFGSEFQSYADILKQDKKRIEETLPYLYELNLGGTAIGNSINASEKYITNAYKELIKITKLPLKQADNMMSQTSSSSDFCHLSAVITILFTDISKIAADIRFLASGPLGGIGEITLKPLQKGSSIMPGKINPIIPEAMNQMAYEIIGKNITIHQAAQHSFLELSLMFPILANSLISMLKLSASGCLVFAESCIQYIEPNTDRAKELLENSTVYATLFSPHLGYDTVSLIVKEAVHTHKTFREVVLAKNLMTEKQFEKISRSN